MPPDNHFNAGGTSFNVMNINLYTQYWGLKTYANIKEGLGKHLATFKNGYNNYNLVQTTGKPYLPTGGDPVFDDIKINETSLLNDEGFQLEDFTDTGLYWCYEVDISTYLINMIQKANLRNTVITILTQHPPLGDMYEAREIAVAFGIRINVLWIKDETFNRCTDQQINDFKTFVDITGGLFVQLQSELNDMSTIDLVSQVFLTHYKPQYVTIGSFSNCTSPKNVPILVDPTVNGPYYFVLLGDNAAPSTDSFRECLLRDPLRSFDNQLVFFQSPDPTCQSLQIKSNGSCTAIVFTNANTNSGPFDLTVYTTYVEDLSLDASRYAIIEKVPFYPALHIQSSSSDAIILNSIAVSYDSTWTNVPQNKTITCDASQTYSLYLNISVGSAIVQRAVRVACVPTPVIPTSSTSMPSTDKPTTSGPSSTPEPSTSTTVITSTVLSTSSVIYSSTTEAACTYDKNNATFLFAYATDFNDTTYGLIYRTIGDVTSQIQLWGYSNTLGNKVFDRKVVKSANYTHNPMDFTNNCEVDKPNSALKADDIQASDALSAIRELLSVPASFHSRLEGSMMIILVNRLPKTDDDLTDDEYDQLTNLNVKIFPMTTIRNLATAAIPGRSGAVFNRIAAQTNGHYIVANDTVGSDVNSDINKIVANVMQTSYTKNLLFTRNVGVSRLGNDLGVLRVPMSATGSPTVSVTITVSLSAVDANAPQLPARIFLGIKPNGNSTNTVSIDFLLSPNVTRYANSNYYITTVDLTAGIERELFLIYLPGPDQSDLLIRMWADGNAYREASYISYSEKTAITTVTKIDENIGAALKFSLDQTCSKSRKATLLITDCNGDVSAKYDSNQVINDNNDTTFYQFVPFFCSSKPAQSTCISGAESKYDAQLVIDTFSITQSFLCRPGSGPSDNCKLQDSNGNNQCSGVTPFKRGPTGSLYDCSNHGILVYNKTTEKFRCDCADNFSGESCEIVECPVQNTDPLATDNNYHTYTVVIGLESAGGTLVYDDGAEFFSLKLPDNLPNIWKYQLMTICADGVYDMIYSGSDLSEFKKLFKTYGRPCNTRAANGVHDLTSIYQQAVKGVGRNVKGIIVYYSEVSSMINVTLDDFIRASQSYQQQMFVYAIDEGDGPTPVTNEDIIKAAMSTGGFLINSNINDKVDGNIEPSLIPDLLQSSSSISWFSSSQYGNFPISTENNSIVSHLLVCGAGTNILTLNQNQPGFEESCIAAGKTYYGCKLSGSQIVLGNVPDVPSFYVAVYDLGGSLTPKPQIISTVEKDASDAVSTSSSDTRTVLTFNVPYGYSVEANDGDGGVTRNAVRRGCTFDTTAYSVFTSQKYSTGTNIAKLTLKKDSKTYTRFYPFGTISAPVCQNGGSPVSSTGSCQCPPGFQGPDCSLVNCLENSTANAWSDVCVCASIDDVACAIQYTSSF
uniref:EGF-like domain-containing protein n=1 Tax=Caenorhabditis tropicalis TaxID=1561998 RepID=A0A1I7T098_9PELO